VYRGSATALLSGSFWRREPERRTGFPYVWPCQSAARGWVCSTFLHETAHTCHPAHPQVSELRVATADLTCSSLAARWVFRCNQGPYAAARIPCTRSHFNPSPSTPPSSRPSYPEGAEGGGLHGGASTPRAPTHHRSHETDLPRRSLNGLVECTAPPLVQLVSLKEPLRGKAPCVRIQPPTTPSSSQRRRPLAQPRSPFRPTRAAEYGQRPPDT
jgi:hypothetical protein